MIIREDLGNGVTRVYSDKGVKIRGGFPGGDYDITYIPTDADRQYVETDIPVEQFPDGKKQYSKVKILLAARDAGFVNELIGLIESDKTLEYIWNASNVIEDNELLADYLPLIGMALGKTESEIRAFLDDNCIVD